MNTACLHSFTTPLVPHSLPALATGPTWSTVSSPTSDSRVGPPRPAADIHVGPLTARVRDIVPLEPMSGMRYGWAKCAGHTASVVVRWDLSGAREVKFEWREGSLGRVGVSGNELFRGAQPPAHDINQLIPPWTHISFFDPTLRETEVIAPSAHLQVMGPGGLALCRHTYSQDSPLAHQSQKHASTASHQSPDPSSALPQEFSQMSTTAFSELSGAKDWPMFQVTTQSKHTISAQFYLSSDPEHRPVFGTRKL
ncbi:hypothetical protein FB451DRAFT_1174345 [Mycena latifolia]|nr:hypothetical protein FB451DRAFT_1174345 [Mycena latifolia]